MSKDEAIKILARHLMQCGMMMPIEWVQKNGEGSEFMQAYEMAMDALKNEPVRCKDCKHWHEGTGWCNHHSHFVDSDGEACHPHESSQWKMLDADDFCSYGERRTDDG